MNKWGQNKWGQMKLILDRAKAMGLTPHLQLRIWILDETDSWFILTGTTRNRFPNPVIRED
jgi:hypothetical protein